MNYKNQISDRVKILLIDEDESIFLSDPQGAAAGEL